MGATGFASAYAVQPTALAEPVAPEFQNTFSEKHIVTKTLGKPKPVPTKAPRELLPLVETVRPTDGAGVVEAIRSAGGDRQPVYPLGGQTSLDFGLAPSKSGLGLDLTGLNRVVDYTPRDMTIAVEAGMTVSELRKTLATENQWLPVDVPRAEDATLGGAVATNWNGSRRYGHGTWRDYLIGISAVDGRGIPFKAGGRVVKNVAGYDFCKLLTASLGTLGVITQLVFKVKPQPLAQSLLVAPCSDLQQAEQALDVLSRSRAAPSLIDLLVGNAWASIHGLPTSASAAWLAFGMEGTPAEVDWMANEVVGELRGLGIVRTNRLEETQSVDLRTALTEFSDRGPVRDESQSPLTVKSVVRPSDTIDIVRMLLAHDPECAIQCHAGSGVVVARFAEFSPNDLTRQLVGKLRPAALHRGGSLIVVSTTLDGLSAPIVWGGRTAAHGMMEKVKRAFDPHGILNPGRMF